MSEEQKTKEKKLFENIYFQIKYGIYVSVFIYVIDVIIEHNMIVSFIKKNYMDKRVLDECLEE